MLIKLKLKNLALIEIIEINFEKGLNIITGDSGSGKSLILDSLKVLFGGTNIPSKHLIRPGKDDCLIEAVFHSTASVNKWLIINGFQNTNREIVIKRKSFKKNKKVISQFSLNDIPINKKFLKALGLLLIDFAGQSETFLFDSQEYRRLIIDELGSKELKSLNKDIKKAWKNTDSLKEFLVKKVNFQNKQKEENLLMKEMFNILDKANLNSSDEILELESTQNKLSNNFEINNSIQAILNNLNNCSHEQPSVGSLINQSLKYLNKISEFDIKIQEFRDKLITIQNHADNLAFELDSYIQEFESSDINLEDTQKRLFFLKNLERTFLLELPQLIEKRDQLKKHLSKNVDDKEIEKLELKLSTMQSNLNSLFDLQSLERRKIANKLQESVIKTLKKLGLENSNFAIDFKKCNPSAEGIDNINFLFSANPDQKLAPLSKVISGGEMSRFLLAIKSNISKKANSFFLDEIDNGLSGKSLSSLVELIKKISQERQVLCITHNPFLAASGERHFKVKKSVIDGLTYTSIRNLSTIEERQNELIELIGGGSGEVNNYASILLQRAAA